MSEVSLALLNGRVWAGRGATAVAVSGDRITAVGDDGAIKPLVNRETRVIDARGASILPGFNDAHVHFLMASRSLAGLDLFGAETREEVERRIRDYARHHGGGWLTGRGWFYSAFDGGMPTVALLDRLVPDLPAFIESFDAHTGWVNSRALAIAGVSTPRVLKESAMLEVTQHIPAPSREDDLDSLRAGMQLARSMGITSIQEAGEGQLQLALWETLRDARELTMRVRLAFDMTPGVAMDDWRATLDAYEALRRDGDGWISTGILKAFADGVVESRTAAMLEPYAGSAERGSPLWAKDELREAVSLADARAWQVQVHAVGDAAIRQALDAFEGTTLGRRHRVEHVETPHPDDVPRFGRLGVVASMQPQHADPKMIGVWARNLGPERAERGWPCRSIMQTGGRLAFGTDWPVVPQDPFASLEMATRSGLNRGDAVSAWTSGSALAEHAERNKGAIREGMLADITVADLEDATVAATIVGGRVVYES